MQGETNVPVLWMVYTAAPLTYGTRYGYTPRTVFHFGVVGVDNDKKGKMGAPGSESPRTCGPFSESGVSVVDPGLWEWWDERERGRGRGGSDLERFFLLSRDIKLFV